MSGICYIKSLNGTTGMPCVCRVALLLPPQNDKMHFTAIFDLTRSPVRNFDVLTNGFSIRLNDQQEHYSCYLSNIFGPFARYDDTRLAREVLANCLLP